MKYATCIAATLASILTLAGCGRSDPTTTAHNEVLGGTPAGAPPAYVPPDAALLKDQTAYQPAPFTAPPGSGLAPGGGVEETAIREVFRKGMAGYFTLNVDDVLAFIDPASIAPVIEQKSAILETVQNMQNTWRLAEPKLAPDLKAAAATIITMLQTQLPDLYANGLKIEVLSPTEASVSVDALRLMQDVQGPLMQLVASLGGTPGGAAPAVAPDVSGGEVVSDGEPAPGGFRTAPGSDVAPAPPGDTAPPTGSPPPAAPPSGLSPEMLSAMMSQSGDVVQTYAVRKIDGAWRIVLPRPMTTAEGELFADALKLINEALDKLSDKVSSVDQITMQDLMPLMQSLQMELMPRMMELAMKFQALQQAVPQPAPSGDDGAKVEGGG